jgi:hypothetical protein
MPDTSALGGGGMSPADMAAVMRGNMGYGNGYGDGWGGGCWWIVLLFIAMMWGGNGMWGNNGFQNAIGYENLATSNEVQRGFDNQNSMANQRDILAAVQGNALQEMQNNNQNTQYITGQVMDKYNELQRDIAGVSMQQQQTMAQQSQCCCETKMLISQTAADQRYESAMQNNALMQAIREEGAATRAQADQRYMAEQDRRIAKLEMQNAMAGVVRYPMSTAYNAGFNPFCNCGNNYGCCGMAA